MVLNQEQQDIMDAKVCPYCKSKTRLVDEVYIYGKSYTDRLIICCVNFPNCDSYVGTHEDGTTLGRLADKELRGWKKQAHDAFDKLWRDKKMERDSAYEELADFLKLPDKFCHIGMFKKETCIKVVAWAKLKYSELI